MCENTGEQASPYALGDGPVDVTSLSLRELASSEDTVLEAATHRRLSELGRPRPVTAGFQSVVDDDRAADAG